MSNNVFPLPTAETQPCALCGEHAAQLSFQDEHFLYGSGQDEVTLTAHVPVWTCYACKGQYTGSEAEDIRHAAICSHLNRLTPSEVRRIREQYGLSQQEWSRRTGFGIASIKRWETGNLIQNESADRYMRLLINADIFLRLS